MSRCFALLLIAHVSLSGLQASEDLCLPTENEAGEIVEYRQWTFLCSNGTMFDQQTLSCNFPSDSYPCELSEDLYNTVEFGVADDVLKIKRI